MTRSLSNIKGLLFDLDGTVYVGDRPIEGAIETIQYLKAKGIPLRFTTNTTTRSLKSLCDKLSSMGLPVEPDETFGVIKAAVAHLRKLDNPRCCLLLTDDPKHDFSEFPEDDENPEQIVIGDIGKYWNYELINRLFRMVMNGAEMIALHKGRYWQTENGLHVDIGAFVAGLEYVTGRKAVVIGKPSKSFFRLALDDLGLPAEQVAMVGDDIINDVAGAQQAGMLGVLVRTGKYRKEFVSQSEVSPDLVIDSVHDLMSMI